VNLKPEDVTYQILEIEREAVWEQSLEKAEVVIAGGWGIGSKVLLHAAYKSGSGWKF